MGHDKQGNKNIFGSKKSHSNSWGKAFVKSHLQASDAVQHIAKKAKIPIVSPLLSDVLEVDKVVTSAADAAGSRNPQKTYKKDRKVKGLRI